MCVCAHAVYCSLVSTPLLHGNDLHVRVCVRMHLQFNL